MGSVKVNTTKVIGQQSSLQKYQKKVNGIEEEVGVIRSGLSFSLQNREKIAQSLASVQSGLQKSSIGLGSLESVLADVMGQYQETEERVKAQCGTLEQSAITDASNISTGNDSGIASEGTDSDYSYLDWFDDFSDFLKKLFTIFNKFFGDEDGGSKSALTDYLKKLVDFFTGDKSGYTGVSDWFSLAGSGSSLWSALYSYLKGQYSNLSKTWGDSADAISVGGSLFGLLAGFMDMGDVLTTADSTTGEKIASGIDAASGIIDVVKSIYNVVTTTVSTGFYTAASLWATFAKTISSVLSQGAKSISNYLSDGVWDLGDTGATGVEIAVSGLTTMISALTLGVLSPESFGTSSEEISAAIEAWAEDLGTAIGEMMMS